MSAAASSSAPSFQRSFLKGSVFSLLLLGIFCLWAYMKGPAFQADVMANLPSVSVPVRDEGDFAETVVIQADEHQSEEVHNSSSTAHTDTHEESRTEEIELHLENLVENSQFGLLPKPDITKNIKPFDAYKRNFIQPAGQRKFQLMVGPIAFSTDFATEIAGQLPQDVSILISPYAAAPDKLMEIFKDSGHEVWLELPIETYDSSNDTGPLSLRADFSGNKNMSVYKRVLGTTTGYVGLFLNAAGQTTLSFSSARMEQLQGDIYQRGVGMAYQAANPVEALDNIAASYQGDIRRITRAEANLFSIQATQWDALLKGNNDLSILYMPHPQDVSELSDWLQSLPEKGYILAPISAPQE